MNLVSLLETQATQHPEQVALVGNRRVTYEQLLKEVSSVAAQLDDAGLGPGDRVLMFHPICVELYVVLLAIFHRGLTAVFVDPGQGRAFINTCAGITKPSAFFGSFKAHILRLLEPNVRAIPLAFHLSGPVPCSRKLSPQAAKIQTPMAVEAEHPALITFTSGSTGLPKGIVRSHAFLLAQHAVLARSIHLVAGEIDLTTLPMFVLANLASGLTTVLADCDWGRVGQADGARIARQITSTQATRTGASPAFLGKLLESDVPRQKLRKIYTGGAPVFPNLMANLAKAYPQAHVEAVYGSSEAEPIAHLPWQAVRTEDLAAMQSGRGLLVGYTVPELQVLVVREHWGKPLVSLTSCEADEIGEIIVSGPHVVSSYFEGRGDKETKHNADGTTWHRTGDGGFYDDEGRLWLTGRCSAIIRPLTSAPLHPFQLETALSFIPEVLASAIVELADQIFLVLETTQLKPCSVAEQKGLDFGVHRIVYLRIPRDKRHNAKVDYGALKTALQKQAT